jgi:hypothetical protein
VKSKLSGKLTSLGNPERVPIFHPPHPSTPRALTDWGDDCGELLLGTVESKAEETTAVASFDLDGMYMMAAWEALL